MGVRQFFAQFFSREDTVKIEISRGEQRWLIAPEQFEDFPFQHGDRLVVISPAEQKAFPVTLGRHQCADCAGPFDSCPVDLRFCGVQRTSHPASPRHHHWRRARDVGVIRFGPCGEVPQVSRLVGGHDDHRRRLRYWPRCIPTHRQAQRKWSLHRYRRHPGFHRLVSEEHHTQAPEFRASSCGCGK